MLHYDLRNILLLPVSVFCCYFCVNVVVAWSGNKLVLHCQSCHKYHLFCAVVIIIVIVSLLLRYYWSFFCSFIFGEQQLSRTSCGVSQRVEFCNRVKLSKNAAKYLILIRLLLMILYFVRLLKLYSVWILFFWFLLSYNFAITAFADFVIN